MLVPAAFTYLCWAVVSTAAVGYVPEALDDAAAAGSLRAVKAALEEPYLLLA